MSENSVQINRVMPVVEKNQYLNDFRLYLEFIGTGQASLTKTGNLTLATLELIASFIDPPELLFPGDKLRSESEWMHVDLIDGFASIMKLTQNCKGKKVLMKRGKDYLRLPLFDQYLALFFAYWECLDWGYLCRYSGEAKDNPGSILQRYQDRVAGYLLAATTWISVPAFLERLRLEFDLKIINNFVESLPFRVDNCIQAALINMLEHFGVLDISYTTENHGQRDYQTPEKMKITALGIIVLRPLV